MVAGGGKKSKPRCQGKAGLGMSASAAMVGKLTGRARIFRGKYMQIPWMPENVSSSPEFAEEFMFTVFARVLATELAFNKHDL